MEVRITPEEGVPDRWLWTRYDDEENVVDASIHGLLLDKVEALVARRFPDDTVTTEE